MDGCGFPSRITTNRHQNRTTDYADDTDSQNDETRMTNDERMTKLEITKDRFVRFVQYPLPHPSGSHSC